MMYVLCVSEVCMCLLQALVHISTAYANCDRRCIDEVVYPAPLSPANVVSAIEYVFSDHFLASSLLMTGLEALW